MALQTTPYWMNDNTRDFLSKGYLTGGQTGEERIRQIAEAAERRLGIAGYADKFEQYMHNGWISLSSPIWANFGISRGLPISCNGSFMDDTTESIIAKDAEIGIMTKYGAGTSLYISKLRPAGAVISRGGTSKGPKHFMEKIQNTTDIISQSSVRRGHCAVYMDVDHPDIEAFLKCRDTNDPIQNLSLGVCISDEWMISLLEGDKKKKRIWGLILKKKFESGYPYLFWTDNVNNNAPQVYKDKGLKIWASNMCAEIALASGPELSFVCDLLSLNVLHYDAWKNTDLVKIAVYFLDCVMEEYIEKTEHIPFMQDARRFAVQQRAIGLGILGWHSLLQSKMIAFESLEAKKINIDIIKTMSAQALEASQQMAAEYGEPELLKGYGRRHVTLMAIAPTTSSSFILGQVSPSIEPLDSNYFTKNLQKGKYGFRNPYLKELLSSKGMDTAAIWKDILVNGGSVQHLDGLSEHEKNVFKTFDEIDQYAIIDQAAHRQKFGLDQSQSLNIKIDPDSSPKVLGAMLVHMWKSGIKTQYYVRGINKAQALARREIQADNCVACEA